MTVDDAQVRTLESLNPATGEVVGRYPWHSPEQVDAAVDRARLAAQWWRSVGPGERRQRLLAFKAVIVKRVEQLAQLISVETGKPVPDSKIEIYTAVTHLDWAAKHAERLLRPRRVNPGIIFANHTARIEYEPVGVVGVLGPWNYPFHTPFGSVTYALAAGNAVVLKPSEFTPGVGAWLVDYFGQVVPEQPVLQLVTGGGDTGEALCRSGVDLVSFTGSSRTARRVMAACADTLTPVVVECGGSDAIIVDEDADVGAAARFAAWAGLSNAGQSCIGAERVYVVDSVYERFMTELVEVVGPLRAGSDAAADFGPITMPSQVDVIRRHVSEALAAGARAVVGGEESVQAPFVSPVVLTDVPETAAAVCEETFGPLLVVNRVRDVDDAIDRTNAIPYGLSASFFGKRRGMDTARRLRVGMVTINAVFSVAGIAGLPFGGVGESGFGRIHGEEGLKSFVRSKSIARRRTRSAVTFTRFHRGPGTEKMIDTVYALLHGRG